MTPLRRPAPGKGGSAGSDRGTGLVEHLERYLGPIARGWVADGDPGPFQVVHFDRGGGPGQVTFTTIGLGRHELRQPSGVVRLEFVAHALRDQLPGPWPGLLHQVGEAVLASHRAPRRGEVFGPAGPLAEGSLMEALYVTSPVYLPDDFASVAEDGKEIVLVWLVPVSRAEAAYVADYGWAAFEERLVERDPDLADLSRPSMW